MAKVWVYADVSPDGKPHPVALELLTKDRERSDEAAAVGGVSLRGANPSPVIVRPKSFAAEASGGTANVQDVNVEIPEDLKKVKRVEHHEEAAAGPKLEEAPVVVSGGRGLQDPANFK